MIRRLCGPWLALVVVVAGTACSQREESVSSAVQAVNATCAHELTCAGGPLAAGSSSSGGCLPPSGDANGWCVHEVCANPNHAYCCSSTWDNGCAQFAATFTRAAGFGFDDCPAPAQNPVVACSGATCTPTTCAAEGATCGTISDSCGGALTCGTCPSGQTCNGNKCGVGTNPGPGSVHARCHVHRRGAGLRLRQQHDGGRLRRRCLRILSNASLLHQRRVRGDLGSELRRRTALPLGLQGSQPAGESDRVLDGRRRPGRDLQRSQRQLRHDLRRQRRHGELRHLQRSADLRRWWYGKPVRLHRQGCPASTGDSCGSVPDGCGGTPLSCGCTSGDVCSSASNGTCQPACVPKTCGSGGVGASCGAVSDGCGSTITCGCPVGESCVSGACQAGGGCTPTSCTAQGKSCGSIPDGCGGTLSCGTCAANATCINDVCVINTCTPQTCSTSSCGSIPDGCGGTLSCGSCPSGQSCSPSNTCQPSGGAIALPSPTLAAVTSPT